MNGSENPTYEELQDDLTRHKKALELCLLRLKGDTSERLLGVFDSAQVFAQEEELMRAKAENEQLKDDVKLARNFYPDLREELARTEKALELCREQRNETIEAEKPNIGHLDIAQYDQAINDILERK